MEQCIQLLHVSLFWLEIDKWGLVDEEKWSEQVMLSWVGVCTALDLQNHSGRLLTRPKTQDASRHLWSVFF
jgi:hypothetical protein